MKEPKLSHVDPIRLRVYQNLLDAIAEEMGSALERCGYSPNITERRDYSCALFDANANMIAQAAHNPVHLGSTPLSVEAAIEAIDMKRGDIVLLNDPYQGGTHLPDLTMVSGVFEEGSTSPIFYVANRAHHSDVGGMARGSMALFEEIYQEGLRIPPVLYYQGGKLRQDIEKILLANMRQSNERQGDLSAQRIANQVGEAGLHRLLDRQDRRELLDYCSHLQDAAERHVERLLESIPDGIYEATEYLESDGFDARQIALRVKISIEGKKANFDFRESDNQVRGCINTNPAVTISAVFYVLRALAGSQIPSNAGCLRPVSMQTRKGSILDPHLPAAVAGGNVECSQRLVDLLLNALSPALPQKIPGQSQGTMNNLSFGHPGCEQHAAFSYYETMGGGHGASAHGNGASGRHSHMSNTRNTPVEVLEGILPLRLTAYSLREQSGGAGKNKGGAGIIREFEALTNLQAAILTERRELAPKGLQGGEDAQAGKNILIRGDSITELPAKWSGELKQGERIRIETPGGGGWGKASE